MSVGSATRLMEDGAGHVTWRARVAGQLAGRLFGGVQLDISPRSHELGHTDIVPAPNSLAFAGIGAPSIELIEVHRHAAEKYHAMLRDYGDRENTRVRDLVDLVILREHGLLDPVILAAGIRQVWIERDESDPPDELPPFPTSWPDRYEAMAEDHSLSTTTFDDAVISVSTLWVEMFTTEDP